MVVVGIFLVMCMKFALVLTAVVFGLAGIGVGINGKDWLGGIASAFGLVIVGCGTIAVLSAITQF